jgi:hypothetical protein
MYEEENNNELESSDFGLNGICEDPSHEICFTKKNFIDIWYNGTINKSKLEQFKKSFGMQTCYDNKDMEVVRKTSLVNLDRIFKEMEEYDREQK